MAGVLVLAPDDNECADALLAPDFGILHPLSADTHRRAWYLLQNHTGFTLPGVVRLFERALERILAVVPNLGKCSRHDALSMQGAIMGIMFGCIVVPEAFRDRWRHAWELASQRGVLQNPWIRLQLAVAGMHVGECGPFITWQLDPATRDFDAADTYLFVRRDQSVELLETLARGIRGERLVAEDGLYGANPVSTVRALAAYVRTCLRDPAHFRNEAQALILLYCAHEVAARTEFLRDRGLAAEDSKRLQAELDKIERVQATEKNRFWELCERTTDPRVRSILVSLWQRSVPASGADKRVWASDSGTNLIPTRAPK